MFPHVSTHTHLTLHELVQRDGVLRLHILLLLLLLLQDKPRGEGVAVDALVPPVRALPEPAVDPLVDGMQEVLAHLGGKRERGQETSHMDY